MFALVATSMAGEFKNQNKRGLIQTATNQAPASFAPSQPLAASYGTPLSIPAAVHAVPAPLPPLPQTLPIQVQNTNSVERINVPQPYPVERTIVKAVGVDRPIPQVNFISDAPFLFINQYLNRCQFVFLAIPSSSCQICSTTISS